MTATDLSPAANEVLAALRKLMACYRQHDCGGFTTDDVKWRMGRPFADIADAINELEDAGSIRCVGNDNACDESACACYVPSPNAASEPRLKAVGSDGLFDGPAKDSRK